jgi:hypothetical protein
VLGALASLRKESKRRCNGNTNNQFAADDGHRSTRAHAKMA